MNRRGFLKAAGALPALAAIPAAVRAALPVYVADFSAAAATVEFVARLSASDYITVYAEVVAPLPK